MKTALVIMAAGLGSRYGGNKQTEGIGPNHEMLMEYSIFDAVRAGFSKFVFVIKPDMKPLIETLCGDLVASCKDQDGNPVEVCYAFQDFSSVPSFYQIPADRTKPFGTVHAVLCAEKYISEPFAVVNADDYYGVDGFSSMNQCLQTLKDGEACMVGYYLKNTVSENGTVTRGVCEVGEDGTMTKVTETYNIRKTPEGMQATDKAGNPVTVREDQHVSMNMWGLPASFIEELATGVPEFLAKLPEGDTSSEYLLPMVIDSLVQAGKARVAMLETKDRWFGVTYREDKETVAAAFARLIADGVYPAKLFG